MGKKLRHKIENYYSVQAILQDGKCVIVLQWDGDLDSLAAAVNKSTGNKWEKIRVLKYTQYIDSCKKCGSPIVCRRRAMLKIAREGCNSLCTKVDENLMRDGVIPTNIQAFFGKTIQR